MLQRGWNAVSLLLPRPGLLGALVATCLPQRTGRLMSSSADVSAGAGAHGGGCGPDGAFNVFVSMSVPSRPKVGKVRTIAPNAVERDFYKQLKHEPHSPFKFKTLDIDLLRARVVWKEDASECSEAVVLAVPTAKPALPLLEQVYELREDGVVFGPAVTAASLAARGGFITVHIQQVERVDVKGTTCTAFVPRLAHRASAAMRLCKWPASTRCYLIRCLRLADIVQRAYDRYSLPAVKHDTFEDTVNATFLGREEDLAHVLDVHLHNLCHYPDVDRPTTITAVHSPGSGKKAFGRHMLDAIFNRPPERGAERARIIAALQDANLRCSYECHWDDVQADEEANVLVATFSRVYEDRNMKAAFEALRGVKPIFVNLATTNSRTGFSPDQKLVFCLLKALGTSAEEANAIVRLSDILRHVVRALTDDRKRGCVLVMDGFYDYAKHDPERYSTLRYFFRPALQEGAIVYAVSASMFEAGSWLQTTEPQIWSGLFWIRMLQLPALDRHDVAAIVAAVFQQHPALAHKVCTTPDAERALSTAGAVQELARVVYQVAGGNPRAVQLAICHLLRNTGAWSLSNPCAIARSIFEKVESDRELVASMDVRAHLRRWCDDKDPDETQMNAFCHEIFDMLAIGAHKSNISHYVLPVRPELMLLGFHVHGSRATSDSKIMMWAGDFAMANIMASINQQWTRHLSALMDLKEGTTERGLKAANVVRSWLMGIAKAETRKAGKQHQYSPRPEDPAVTYLHSVTPILACVSALDGTACTSPHSFKIPTTNNPRHDVVCVTAGGRTKLVLRCTLPGHPPGTNSLDEATLSDEIAVTESPFRDPTADTASLAGAAACDDAPTAASAPKAKRRRNSATGAAAAHGALATVTDTHTVLVLLSPRLSPPLQAIAGPDACIVFPPGAYSLAPHVHVSRQPVPVPETYNYRDDATSLPLTSAKPKMAESMSGAGLVVPPGMTLVVLNPLHDNAFPLFTGVSSALFFSGKPEPRPLAAEAEVSESV